MPFHSLLSGRPHATLPAVVALLFSATFASPRPSAAQQPGAPSIAEQQTGVRSLIQAVHATSATTVWAAGPRGTVLRTTDGGSTWERRPTQSGDSLEFRDIHALNSDTAWVLAIGNGDKSRIYRTTDGGSSWTLQFMNADKDAFYDCISFGNSTEGIVFGDAVGDRTHILRTTNAGNSWSLLPPDAVPAPLKAEGGFAASGLCAAHDGVRNVYIATGAPGARLLKSTDAGAHWQALETPFVKGQVAGLTAVSFHNNRGVAVAADINRLRNDTSSKVVGITTDGGKTWALTNRPALPGALAGVALVYGAGPDVIVATSYGGASWSTTAGREWTAVTDVVTTGVSAFGRTVWIGGTGGKIWKLEFPASTK